MTKKRVGLEENMTTILISSESQEQEQKGLELRARLAEVRKLEGVLGYILKDATSALLDLDTPEEIVEYAMLSQEAFDSYNDISANFDLGNIENIIVECTNTKIICATIDQSSVTLIMEKEIDYTEILKRLQPIQTNVQTADLPT